MKVKKKKDTKNWNEVFRTVRGGRHRPTWKKLMSTVGRSGHTEHTRRPVKLTVGILFLSHKTK